jgi:hypothetical protein
MGGADPEAKLRMERDQVCPRALLWLQPSCPWPRAPSALAGGH